MSYSKEYWDNKIQKYKQEDWSRNPSPFARLVLPYISGENILELGTGAGQDGLWFAHEGKKVVMSDATDFNFREIKKHAKDGVELVKFDITHTFPFKDKSFDAVYAQLVIHYFDNETTKFIFSEIYRVLRDGGVVALMVNSIDDPEYDKSIANGEDIVVMQGIPKRYFSVESLTPFVENFEAILFSNKGCTPKDDAVNNSGMIQFIGSKK